MDQSRGQFRIVLVALVVATLAGTAFVLAADRPSATARERTSSELAVHEWGTFTSVAGPDGSAIEWRALSGPSDLPCFVDMLPDNPKLALTGGLPAMAATVRMETPVLYFYSPRAERVDVSVRFPHGLITEWFPHANVTPAISPYDLARVTSAISWANVQLVPGTSGQFPIEPGESHYYAARETDATPLQVAGQAEKFLFYRGLASFPVPVSAKVSDHGQILVENTGGHDISHLILLESRSGRVGYRIVNGPKGQTVIDPPVLGNGVELLGADFERMLTEAGLYPREAKAMVATWRDSWFEEGTRLFYLLPQAAVDEVLPLDISPKPAQIARVFVGRLEILTPAVQDAVEQALVKNDLATLDRYGRFLEPIAWRVLAKSPSPLNPASVQAVLRRVAARHERESSCR
jgi:hypothetical protein